VSESRLLQVSTLILVVITNPCYYSNAVNTLLTSNYAKYVMVA